MACFFAVVMERRMKPNNPKSSRRVFSSCVHAGCEIFFQNFLNIIPSTLYEAGGQLSVFGALFHDSRSRNDDDGKRNKRTSCLLRR